MKRKFVNGDKVFVTMAYDGNTAIKGKVGTICDDHAKYANYHSDHAVYGVKFRVAVDGHDCGQTCKDGYGWYIPTTHLQFV